jgi:hypothetical protein
MQIEKKLIACSILAIAIGIATIIPLQYLMNAQAAAALPNVEPYFNVNVDYAYCNPYQSGGNGTASWDGAMIQAVANFSLTADATEPDADAQVEYYKFAVSSDQGPITDMYYYVIEGRPVSIGLNSNGTINFDGLTFSPPASNNGQSIIWSGQGVASTVENPLSSVYGALCFSASAFNGQELPQAATQLRNAQTLSIDVTKICTVTIKGNVIVTTAAEPTVLQHIELTKTDKGFVYGTYTEGSLPFPIAGTQATPTTPAQIFTPDYNMVPKP